MSHYPLTRKDFEDATRVLQRMIEFRDKEFPPNSFNDRSAHLRESIKTLALACDFWAAPEPPAPLQAPQQQRQPRQGQQRSRKSQGHRR